MSLRSVIAAAAWALCLPAAAEAAQCRGDPTSEALAWYERFCSRLTDTWKRGDHEILLSGYTWHLPWTYTRDKRKELEDLSWGAGYGRIAEDPNGDTHSVFGFAFRDSHGNAQLQVGYTWSRFWGPRDGLQGGLGYTVMIVQRPDIFDGVPFPAALPLFSLRYGQASLVSTFIPTVNGGVNNGSVIFLLGRYTFK
ncbi:lipid IVA palmitoyltransferase [Burkholderiales bacterium]|nr:lipid IVA palmitoyltransferase [Burkholderiales bacterium]